MSLLDIIVKFVKSLFETKEREMEIVSVTEEAHPRMKKDVFAVMTTSESDSTKERLWKEMIEHEQNGETVYTIYSDKWEYIIRNGQFIVNPIHEK